MQEKILEKIELFKKRLAEDNKNFNQGGFEDFCGELVKLIGEHGIEVSPIAKYFVIVKYWESEFNWEESDDSYYDGLSKSWYFPVLELKLDGKTLYFEYSFKNDDTVDMENATYRVDGTDEYFDEEFAIKLILEKSKMNFKNMSSKEILDYLKQNNWVRLTRKPKWFHKYRDHPFF